MKERAEQFVDVDLRACEPFVWRYEVESRDQAVDAGRLRPQSFGRTLSLPKGGTDICVSDESVDRLGRRHGDGLGRFADPAQQVNPLRRGGFFVCVGVPKIGLDRLPSRSPRSVDIHPPRLNSDEVIR